MGEPWLLIETSGRGGRLGVARGDAVPEISGTEVLREAVALLTWRAGPADFPTAFHWLPEALALAEERLSRHRRDPPVAAA